MSGKIMCFSYGKYEWILTDIFWKTNKPHPSEISSPSFFFRNCPCTLNLIFSWKELTLGFYIKYGKRLHVELDVRSGLTGERETRSGTTENNSFVVKLRMSSLPSKICRWPEVFIKGSLTVYCKLSTVSDAQENHLHKELEPNREEVKEENNAPGTDVHESLTSDSTGSPHRGIMLPNNECLKKLIEDLESLLSSDDDSDVTLNVQGKAFPAHKAILRARSPVFKSMFSHNMLEKESGVVNLDDCNPDTFPDFLKYLYTGNTEHISLNNVFDLYTVSDKYCINELKVECSLFIRRNLSVETFCDSIILGLRHDEKELIDAATDFFCRCTAEIVKTPKWQIFLRENPDTANELFIKSLSSK